MSLAVFDINDAGIQLSIEGQLVRTSPGIAVLDRGRLLTGESASQNVKLLPRWTNNRYWSQLNTNPLPNGTDQVRHHADIAFSHLEELWLPVKKEVSSAILVVPGYFRNDNLGLLLGMARECELPVRGVVDHSVIVASNLPLRPTVLHLDVHLHSITLTRVHNGGILTRRDVKTVLETGLASLWDRWANIIASQFIQTTRFDPMHNAATEQELYNQLPAWIRELSTGSMHAFAFHSGSTEHTVAISHENLLKACTPLYPQIVQAIRNEMKSGEPVSLLLSHRLKGFPGLKESLQLIANLEVLDLAEFKAIESATEHRQRIVNEGGAVSHIIQMDTGEISHVPHAGAAPSIGTHLLWRHHAFPITQPLAVDADLSEGPKFSKQPVFTAYTRNNQVVLDCHEPGLVTVNGRGIEGTVTLSIGDEIALNGEHLTLISVLSSG